MRAESPPSHGTASAVSAVDGDFETESLRTAQHTAGMAAGTERSSGVTARLLDWSAVGTTSQQQWVQQDDGRMDGLTDVAGCECCASLTCLWPTSLTLLFLSRLYSAKWL